MLTCGMRNTTAGSPREVVDMRVGQTKEAGAFRGTQNLTWRVCESCGAVVPRADGFREVWPLRTRCCEPAVLAVTVSVSGGRVGTEALLPVDGRW